MLLRTRQFLDATEQITTLMSSVKTGGPIDINELKSLNKRFESRARSYNYYKYILEQRLISAPVEFAEHAIEVFEDYNTTMGRRLDEFELKYVSLMNFLNQVTDSWSRVQEARNMADEYLLDLTMQKTDLAQVLTSKALRDDLDTIEEFLAQVATRSHDLLEGLQAFAISYNKMWENMLNEASLDKFYAKIAEDYQMFLVNETFRDYWDGKAAYMLKTKSKWVVSNRAKLEKRMNADFFNKTAKQQTEINWEFIRTLQPLFDVSECLETGQRFFKAMSNVTENMQKFLAGNVLDHEYYR
jgi:hypothetical protein